MTPGRYRVLIPYTEDHPDHPYKVFDASIEVDAASPEEAGRLGMAEFRQLAEVSGTSWNRRIIRDGIRVEEITWEARGEERFRVDRFSPVPGVAVCRISGIADTHAMPDIQQAMEEAVASGASTLIIDLSSATYMNSSCIGLLIGRLDGIRMLLVGTPEKIGRVFRMLGIDSLFQTYRTINDALRSLSGKP
ncbi:MAG: STAS domain-containing protein [Planctomycetota bacterium]|nr:STAS domain-containing protein [Planctomycetota bacterium]